MMEAILAVKGQSSSELFPVSLFYKVDACCCSLLKRTFQKNGGAPRLGPGGLTLRIQQVSYQHVAAEQHVINPQHTTFSSIHLLPALYTISYFTEFKAYFFGDHES
jgi:hypothetical protein